MWGTSRQLLVAANDVYTFLKELESGEIRNDGTQPFLPDVLAGVVQYTIKQQQPQPGQLRAAYAQQMRNALNRVQKAQYELLNKELSVESLRTSITIKNLLQNLKVGASTQAKR